MRTIDSASVPTGCNEFVSEKKWAHRRISNRDNTEIGLSAQYGEMSTVAYDQGWESEWDDMKKYGPFSRHLRRIIKNIIRPLNLSRY